MDYTQFLKYFIGLMAIINPIGLLPIFSSLTESNTKAERFRVNATANFAVAIILIVSMLFGKMILNWFSISINSFQIAGGIMIATIALVMIHGKLEEGRHNADERKEASAKDSIAVVPLAMPLMAGPGAISQVGVDVIGYGGTLLVIVAFSLVSFLIFSLSQFMIKVMGKTGINIVTRIMGIIMLSIAIEMIATGIKGLFHMESFLKFINAFSAFF